MVKEDFLDAELIKEFGHPVVDGITNASRYFKAPERILWILKEANDSGAEQTWNQREFHKDIRSYKNWKATYSKIVQASYGILNKVWKYEELPSVDDLYDVMNDIAFINLKKVGGESRANQAQIIQFAEKYSGILQKQIETINPTVIIHGHNVWSYFTKTLKAEHRYIGNVEYALQNDVKHINAYHPNSTQDTQE